MGPGEITWAVSPICLGTNVFGWTVDEALSYEILDRYRNLGGNFIDTADSYSVWAEGNPGGTSERIIGNWIADRGGREELIIATKVGQMPDFSGYGDHIVRESLDASLERLRLDYVDLIYAHRDYDSRPLAEVARTFHNLIVDGKARHVGLSNFGPERAREWLAACDAEGLTRPTVIQPHYNLLERGEVETGFAHLAREEELIIVSYAGLARGFLSGRYRRGKEVSSPRAYQAEVYKGKVGDHVLEVLDTVAASHHTTLVEVALAWVLSRPYITSTIVSASSPDQLDDVMRSARLRLNSDEVAALDRASEK